MKPDLHLASLSNPSLIPKGRIGRFVYESEIGQGSVGIVYLFRDPLIGRKVAIKILNPQLPANQRQLFEKHFIQEARAAGRLNHPNIVTVYDADKSGDLLFIVMEYLEGQELRDMLSSGHQFSYKQIAELIGRIASALDYAHENGVIHRDIKPANIFITAKGSPKVLDFGIASASRQLSDPDATLGHDQLSERRLLGTPNYMSPEQTRSETVDARSDIFSLGVMLYQLLCGQLPFKGVDVHALLHAIAHEPAIPPHEIKPDVPPRLARIAAKALAKKPADRYQKAADMARDLNRFLDKERTERIIAKIQSPEQNKIDAANRTTNEPLPEQTDGLSQMITLARRKPAITAAIGLTLFFGLAWMLYLATPSALPPAIQTEQISARVEPTPPEITLPASPPAMIAPLPAAAVNSMPEPKAPAPAKATGKQLTASVATSKPEPAILRTGSVAVAVSPWGEVYVDGQNKGVAPPLNKLTLPIGKHKIEIKNGDDSYAVNIEVNSEKEVKVSHRF